eukprot:m.34689 g.34689  ORF g.34689 m.34689 type:complete len:333 (+) comp6548_c0_seq2:97-1095(+)
METTSPTAAPVKKEILKEGDGVNIHWKDGDKAMVHFKTVNMQTGEIVDSSEDMYLGALDLRIGKKFLMSQWEDAVKTMQLGEVSRFEATKDSVLNYAQFGRVYRDASRKKHAEDHGEHYHSPAHGCCAHMVENDKDADLYALHPGVPLAFEFKLVGVEKANSYEKELWEMSVEEKIESLPHLKECGNSLFKEKKFEQANERYTRALGIIENLSTMKVSHGNIDEETNNGVQAQKPVFLSNLCACELQQKNYADVIKHASLGIDIDPTNVKLLFRRAKAHYERGRDLDLAQSDAEKVQELNPNDKAVEKLISQIKTKDKKQNKDDAALYKKMF